MIWNTLVLALGAIRRNAARSLLTALGVVIGVGSVIAMVNLGQSATQQVTAQITAMGPNLLFVRPTSGMGPGGARLAANPFTPEDVDAIATQIAGVRVAPSASASATVAYGSLNVPTSILGTTNDYFEVRSLKLTSGRIFEQRELDTGSAVCLLGPTVVNSVYGTAEPIGTMLRVGATGCQVIGVLESKGSNTGQDQDDVVVMPMSAVQRRITGKRDIAMIYVAALEDGSGAAIKAEMTAILRERRGLRDGEVDDFDIRDMAEVAATLTATTETMTALLGAIAAVSLLVGGIGIMNIMLVSVTERTREIGVRLAIGARAREILLQFLVEAVVLSVFGGAVGIALGIGGTYVVTMRLAMPFVVSMETVIAAFVVSAAVGVLFGYLPARKAARLDPIDALRHE
ncbi:MAG: ABC transporter permease [Deltaproteobacteria bacterium]|nr:ABC transporter permease [Nannocystaceae bacterium]